MQTIPQILKSAGIRYQDYSQAPRQGIFLTAANQLIGSYNDLTRFSASRRAYAGWEAHHIVEAQDLDRLGIAQQFPAHKDQICVLIPRAAHRKRINSILRHSNPAAMIVNAFFLEEAYKDAYSLVGNYCGGGEKAIRSELLSIVSAIFRAGGVPRTTPLPA